jgi:AcrR family transcriptional regulator
MMGMAEDVNDKRAAIMKAALILFTQRGFHGTPTAMISDSAGVSTGTLFRCFETKNDLINCVYFSAKERMALATCAGCDEEKDYRGKIKRIWGNLIRWGVENPYEFLFIEQFSTSPFITDVTQEQLQKNYLFLFDVLDEGVNTGLLKSQDRMLVLEMLYSANVAVVKKLIKSGDTKDLDMTIDRSFDFVWGGIAHK